MRFKNFLPECVYCVTRWLSQSANAGLEINRSRVRILAALLSSATTGQVVNIYVPLSPSSIIWYQPMGGDALRLGR